MAHPKINPSKKTIIFDFGNVLLNLNFKRCVGQFQDVLNVDFSPGLPEKTKEVMYKYDRGHISSEAFLWHLQQYKPSAEIRDIIAAWNSFLTPVPMERFEMIESLRERFNIVMLSNINDLHIEHIHRDLEQRLGIEDFHSTYFDVVYYSCCIGMRKPDHEIYEYVLSQLGIKGEDILFIDDMDVNIEACKKAGWHGVVHDPKTEIMDEIEGYIRVFT